MHESAVADSGPSSIFGVRPAVQPHIIEIILAGPPGAGKDEQSRRLVAALEKEGVVIHVLGTGARLNQIVKAKGPGHADIRQAISSGNLVPDAHFIPVFKAELENIPKHRGTIALLNGALRSVSHCTTYEHMLAGRGRKGIITRTIFFEFKVPEHCLRLCMDRIINDPARKDRSDNALAVIKTRFRVHREHNPLVCRHAKRIFRHYHVLDGLAPIPDIHRQIMEVLGKKALICKKEAEAELACA